MTGICICAMARCWKRIAGTFDAAYVARAIIMPNLVPPVVRGEDARAYRESNSKAALDRTDAQATLSGDAKPLIDIVFDGEHRCRMMSSAAAEEGLVHAVKLYPAGATTNSDSGVRNIEAVLPVLERMASVGLPLCVHGEVTDPEVDIFDREAVFIERVLDPVRQRVEGLRVVMEHVTTADAVDYVNAAPVALGATITPHHLIINRNHLLVGGIKPHYYCLPIVKRERHRLALRKAATSGDARFFLGTDSAPHADHTKEAPCGCAGVFNAPNTLSCLAHVFEEESALDRLEAFTSLNGPAFYGLPSNVETITLVKEGEPVIYPEKIETGAGPVTVFDPGFPLYWRVG